MRLILLLACTDAAKPTETGKDARETGDTAETRGGGDSEESDTGGRDTASGESGDDSDSDPESDADTGSADATLDALLADLRADPAGTLLAVSRTSGWPAPVEGGWLFVTTARGDWSLAGDHSGWSPEAMTRESGFSWLVREASPGGGYKFTDGADWNPDPWSRCFRYDEFGEMSCLVPDGEQHLARFVEVEGEGLRARTLHVLVPAEPVTHVLYAEDGQNLYDPEAIWGGWRLDESAPAGMLIVGIENTPDRMEEYTHVEDRIHGTVYGGWGDTYADYLQSTVRPVIRDVYGEPGPVGLLGSSLGGLISFHIADQYPGEYAFAASMSGTMGWGSIGTTNETMIERYAAAGHRGTALYLDSGGDGTCYDSDGDGIEDDDPSSSDNYCENIQFRDVLYGLGYEYEVDLWHWWEPDADHDEQAWADRVWRPLEIFAGF